MARLPAASCRSAGSAGLNRERRYRRLEQDEIQAASSTPIGGWARSRRSLRALDAIANKHGVSIANVATRWTLDHPAVAAVIVGARLGERDHRDDNQAIFSFTLDDDDHRSDRCGAGLHDADPRRLRRRISQAAVSHSLRRSQRITWHSMPKAYRSDAGGRPAGAVARLIRERL